MKDIEKAIETLKMDNELMQFDPMTGEIEPIELQNQDNQDLYNANLVAIEALEKQLNSWIPVSERLPEKSGKYLITIKNLTGFEIPKEYVFICDYFHAIKEFMFDTWEDNKIVAWQPLPEPYKEVE